jgi:hypothetical protein
MWPVQVHSAKEKLLHGVATIITSPFRAALQRSNLINVIEYHGSKKSDLNLKSAV